MTMTIPASLRRDGLPVTQLYPGWQVSERHQALAGLDVLILHHMKTGQKACWWLSPDDNILACHALALSDHWNELVMETVSPVLHQLSTTLLSGEVPLPTDDTFPHRILTPLTSLPPVAQFQLLGLWGRTISTGLRRLSPASLLEEDGTQSAPDAPAKPSPPFPTDRIRSLLDTRLAGPHTLTKSPFSDRTLRAELTMPTEKGTACRFSDEENGQTFYLFWHSPTGQETPPKDQQPFFYHPKGRLLLGDGPFIPLIPVFLLSWFVSNPHCVEELKHAHPFRLEDYGVGRASALWEDMNPVSPTPSVEKRKETGQTGASFPFSSKLWVRSSIFRAGQASGLPDRERWKKSPPQNHENETDAGHENHDES